MPTDPSGEISKDEVQDKTKTERRNSVGNSGSSSSGISNKTRSSVLQRPSIIGGAGAAGVGGKITTGSRCTIAEASEIRGNVHFGDGTIIHPKAIIKCVQENSKIIFGKDCIIEERVQIIFTGEGEMKIGDKNLFEVDCKIECFSIGSHNTFECKSRVLENVIIQDFTTVGAGCIAQPPADWTIEEGKAEKDTSFVFPSRTVIYGHSSTARIWSGNGVRQADALYAKHQEHLRRSIPKEFKLKMIK